MNSIRIAVSELRRMSAGLLPKIALLALVLIPSLYTGLYLYSNQDPYANLKNVKAALVVEDKDSTVGEKKINVGQSIAKNLIDGNKFDWQKVSLDEAESGVSRNEFAFALVIPSDFSQKLTSVTQYKPEKSELKLITNDANNYIIHTVASTVGSTIIKTVASQVSAEAAENLLLGLSDVRSQLGLAANGAQTLSNGLTTAKSGSSQLANGTSQLSSGASQLNSGLGQLNTGISALPGATVQLSSGAQQVADGNAQIAAQANQIYAQLKSTIALLQTYKPLITQTITEAKQNCQQNEATCQIEIEKFDQALSKVDEVYAGIDSVNANISGKVKDINSLAAGSEKLAAGIKSLSEASSTIAAGVSTASEGMNKLSDASTQLDAGAKTLDGGLSQLNSGSEELAQKLSAGQNKIPDISYENRSEIASTLADPVTLTDESQTVAGSYGAGLAPFFMSLSAWVGAFALFTLFRPLSSRALSSNQSSLKTAIGGWLAPAVIGVFQMIVMFAIVTLSLKIEPVHVALALAFLILVSITFVAIIHAFMVLFGKAGQFIGLVVLILQLTSSGGTFPWQTTPAIFQSMHAFLPMGYSVDALRHLFYGGDLSLVAKDALVFVIYFVAAISISTIAARKQRVWQMKKLQPAL